MRASSGTTRDRSLKSSQLMSDAGRARDGHQVHGVIGGAAGGQQADDGVDDARSSMMSRQRQVVLAERGDRGARAGPRRASARRAAACSGGTKALPGRCRPMTSISIWLLLAVP